MEEAARGALLLILMRRERRGEASPAGNCLAEGLVAVMMKQAVGFTPESRLAIRSDRSTAVPESPTASPRYDCLNNIC